MRSSTALARLSVLALLVVACGGNTAPATDQATTRPSAPSNSPASALESGHPSGQVSSAPAATQSASATPEPSAFLVATVVTTLADDGLRVRSEPRISDDSRKLEPLLPIGSQLYVLGGPVAASGYTWYEVVPLTATDLPTGWVASASRDGEPWIAPSDFDCPRLPSDFRALAALAPGVGLACFARVPITVDARIISCRCDMDGAWYTPSWFFLGSGGPTLLVEPGQTAVPSDPRGWFALNLDPAGQHPDVLPDGALVRVTGIFDHPAAATCTRTEMDGNPVPSRGCRLAFAVTELLLYGP